MRGVGGSRNAFRVKTIFSTWARLTACNRTTCTSKPTFMQPEHLDYTTSQVARWCICICNGLGKVWNATDHHTEPQWNTSSYDRLWKSAVSKLSTSYNIILYRRTSRASPQFHVVLNQQRNDSNYMQTKTHKHTHDNLSNTYSSEIYYTTLWTAPTCMCALSSCSHPVNSDAELSVYFTEALTRIIGPKRAFCNCVWPARLTRE